MTNHLESYNHFAREGKEGYVLSAESDAVAAGLILSGGATTREVGGRGHIYRFALHNGGEGILRTYQRGGVVARVLGDRYFSNRMFHEFELTAALFASGAPVPEPLGVIWQRRGLVYRGALATRALEGVTLLDYLNANDPDPALLRRCGEAVRQLHDAGVWHDDLQVKNILVVGEHVWVIDFDNARQGKPLSPLARARNLLRFRRSLDKHGQSLDNFTTFWEGYGKLGLPWWLSTLYRFRGSVSDTLQR